MKKAERLNQELIFLRDKTQFQLHDLMHEFHISKRTALRDIDDLAAMGLPYYTEPGRYGGYRLINSAPLTPIYFNLDEVRAVFFALNAMAALSDTPFEKSYRQIRAKMMATLPTEQQQLVAKMDQFVYFYTTAPVRQSTDLTLLLHAILNTQVVTGLNTQRATTPVRLQVYELFYRNGVWFCSAQDLNQNEWHTYRCDYLTELSIASDVPAPYTTADLKALQDHYEQTYHNTPFRCRLTAAGVEHFLRDHYPNMRLEQFDGQTYLTGGYHQSELDYMTHYLLSYGNNVFVESPRQLQNRYCELLAKIQSQYH